MTKYILHGGFMREDNESNHAFFRKFVRDVPENGSALLVFFASRGKPEDIDKISWITKRFTEYANERQVRIETASEERFLEQVRNADAVYLHGGSTNKLLAKLKTYPDFKRYSEGKTVAGSSAGAYVLARFRPSHDEPKVREGLGLLPLRVVCHYESEKLPPDPEAIEALKETAQELELVLLHDFEWRVFNT